MLIKTWCAAITSRSSRCLKSFIVFGNNFAYLKLHGFSIRKFFKMHKGTLIVEELSPIGTFLMEALLSTKKPVKANRLRAN